MRNDSALFFTCSLIEYIGRQQKQKRSMIVTCLGRDVVKRIYKYADVFHCEPIEKVADEFIARCEIPTACFDNVAGCRYEVPDYWIIGEVYERLIEDIVKEDVTDGIVDCIVAVYTSWIDDVISNYNSDFYYQSREYICECYKEGRICA
ncbi:MAG: hypothetical protein NC079_07815 [Clostridium sp.]|nr:hypothetical protein [Acetatifactor muris]MCM1527823.1 hypothetical protein [Bacteroides sp.]MCM1563503.1 hypothetical protein [Clostridium sp.]